MGTNSTYRKTISASTKNLSDIRDFVAGHAETHGFSGRQIADIRLAVDEAITNIIKHAYKGDDNHSIEITIDFNNERICIELQDTGSSFDFKDFPEPNIQEKIKQRKRGGMGVYLIHSLMDDVTYGRQNQSNKMKMCKYRT
ncbi:MAG: ATP-binding protein [Balneolaceae bacterium]